MKYYCHPFEAVDLEWVLITSGNSVLNENYHNAKPYCLLDEVYGGIVNYVKEM